MAKIQSTLLDYTTTNTGLFQNNLVLDPRDTLIASTNLGNWNLIRMGTCFYPVGENLDLSATGQDIDNLVFNSSYTEDFPASTERDIFAFAMGAENKWNFNNSNYVGVFVGPDSGPISSFDAEINNDGQNIYLGRKYPNTWTYTGVNYNMLKPGSVMDGIFDTKTPRYAYGVSNITYGTVCADAGDNISANWYERDVLGFLSVQLRAINKGQSTQQMEVKFCMGTASSKFHVDRGLFIRFIKQLNMGLTSSSDFAFAGYGYRPRCGGTYTVDWHRSGVPLDLPRFLIFNNPYLGLKLVISNLMISVSD